MDKGLITETGQKRYPILASLSEYAGGWQVPNLVDLGNNGDKN
jgi:hypothetical protein